MSAPAAGSSGVNRLATGGSEYEITAQFAGSSEYLQLHGYKLICHAGAAAGQGVQHHVQGAIAKRNTSCLSTSLRSSAI